jgi:hypothetical protein
VHVHHIHALLMFALRIYAVLMHTILMYAMRTYTIGTGMRYVLRLHARCMHVRRKCSLSLWRVVPGSKLMHLDSLIHGLFII